MIQDTVTSRDGTTIAYEQSGAGPALIIVASALSDRSDARKLAGLLSSRFTVINYDRRGRGRSTDTQPYAVEREIEDIAALLEVAGGSASVFGSSSGAVLALRAAASGLPITRMALFEPPFRLTPNGGVPPAQLEAELRELLDADRRGDAVKRFMSVEMGVPGIGFVLMRLWPGLWKSMTAMAPTILHDLAVMDGTTGGGPLPPEWAQVTTPTLVMDGGKSEERLRSAAAALAELLPNAQHRTLEGQSHAAPVMNPKSVAPIVTDFLERASAGPARPQTTKHHAGEVSDVTVAR
jgi:pimeloyl-ACP methyl ester carboxylesterase